MGWGVAEEVIDLGREGGGEGEGQEEEEGKYVHGMTR